MCFVIARVSGLSSASILLNIQKYFLAFNLQCFRSHVFLFFFSKIFLLPTVAFSFSNLPLNSLISALFFLAEASQRNVEERIKREKDKRINSYGETRLHEAARSDDQQYLKALIAAVCFQIFVLFVR